MIANKSYLARMIVPNQVRSFSVAGTIHDKFEAAYAKRKAQLGKNPAKK